MKHKLAVLVENNPGVLAKVSNLFSRRGYNIESLVVSDTEDKTISRMTIVVEGDEKIIEQVGYTDGASFRKHFKRILGTTPLQFRKLHTS